MLLKENQTGQSKICPSNCPSLAKRSLVGTDGINVFTNSSVTTKKYSKQTPSAMGLFYKKPYEPTNATIFCEFIRKLLCKSKMSERSSDLIAKNAWRQRLQSDHGVSTRRWLQYCKEKEKDKFDLGVSNIVGFLDYCFFEKKATYIMLTKLLSFASNSRKLLGTPLNKGEHLHIQKYITACFNSAPPIPKKKPGTWDVNILLDYFVGLGDNKGLTVNSLAGKSLLLILLSTMCRGGELLLLKVTNMSMICGGIEFILDVPTKTYNRTNFTVRPNLQKLTLTSFDENPLLCPVKTLLEYLEATTAFRGFIEPVFICCLADHTHPASKDTINRWIKTHMSAAGLGSFEVRSSHHASSTTALLSGIPLDKLIDQVGWSTASTFVSNYMLPMMPNVVTETVALDPSTSVLDDQHRFSKIWQRQPQHGSSTNQSVPQRSNKFVKIQENKINNARARLKEVIKGEGGEHSPMVNTVKKPSKLTSKLKSKLKLSKLDHPKHSLVSTKNTATRGQVKGKSSKTEIEGVVKTKANHATTQSKTVNTGTTTSNFRAADKSNADKLSKILEPID